MESSEHSLAFTEELFRRQASLSSAVIFEVSGRYIARDELLACMDAPQTRARLDDDIAWAIEHRIGGTPLVLVNGRRAPLHPGLLYALILAKGETGHPALQSLIATSSETP
jgi:serine/threonine-protein kinase